MGILKFGVIGILIMLPFLFISYSKEQSVYQHEQLVDYCSRSIEQATSDAAFAMKTYSVGTYDGESAYRIDIPYSVVVSTFFDSLTHLEFPYVRSEFLFLVFIEYDGVVLYQPLTDVYYPKQFYQKRQGQSILYTDLKSHATLLHEDTGIIEHIQISKEEADLIILESVENILNLGLVSAYPSLYKRFELPVYDDSYLLQAINDLSLIAIYHREASDFIGNMDQNYIKPSGIMKVSY